MASPAVPWGPCGNPLCRNGLCADFSCTCAAGGGAKHSIYTPGCEASAAGLGAPGPGAVSNNALHKFPDATLTKPAPDDEGAQVPTLDWARNLGGATSGGNIHDMELTMGPRDKRWKRIGNEKTRHVHGLGLLPRNAVFCPDCEVEMRNNANRGSGDKCIARSEAIVKDHIDLVPSRSIHDLPVSGWCPHNTAPLVRV